MQIKQAYTYQEAFPRPRKEILSHDLYFALGELSGDILGLH